MENRYVRGNRVLVPYSFTEPQIPSSNSTYFLKYTNQTFLRQIVSSTKNLTQGISMDIGFMNLLWISKHLTQVLSPLIGKVPYFIKNSTAFVKIIKDLEILQGRCMISNDVSTLFYEHSSGKIMVTGYYPTSRRG